MTGQCKMSCLALFSKVPYTSIFSKDWREPPCPYGGNWWRYTTDNSKQNVHYQNLWYRHEFSTPSLLSSENHPAVHLRCQKGKHITDIEFASYGNPVQDCRDSGRSCQGSCHAEMSEFVVKNVKFCHPSATFASTRYSIAKMLQQSTNS